MLVWMELRSMMLVTTKLNWQRLVRFSYLVTTCILSLWNFCYLTIIWRSVAKIKNCDIHLHYFSRTVSFFFYCRYCSLSRQCERPGQHTEWCENSWQTYRWHQRYSWRPAHVAGPHLTNHCKQKLCLTLSTHVIEFLWIMASATENCINKE